MTGLHCHILSHRFAAAWLAAAALLLKLLVPAGYMPAAEHGTFGIELCSGYGPMAMPMPGHHGQDHGKLESPCEFSALGSAALGSRDPPILAEPAHFAELPSLSIAIPVALAPLAYLRPPLRGPPAI